MRNSADRSGALFLVERILLLGVTIFMSVGVRISRVPQCYICNQVEPSYRFTELSICSGPNKLLKSFLKGRSYPRKCSERECRV